MSSQKKLRVAYLSGPIDALKVFNEGQDSDFFGTIYMRQFFQICDEYNAESYVITTLPGNYFLERANNLIVDNRPLPYGKRGVFYHLGIGLWFVRFLPNLLRYRPDALIVTEVANYWFLLAPARWIGIKIIPAMHCPPWPKFESQGLLSRFLMVLNRTLIYRHIKNALAVSDDAAKQLHALIGSDEASILVFNATYPRNQFVSFVRPEFDCDGEFRVFFAGRIETNKGIYDLLDIAIKLDGKKKSAFRFDICGDGLELASLRARIEKAQLSRTVVCHGWCNTEQISDLLRRSHCVIIPTTTSFEEGFPKVFAEAILAGRPVITSAVCITKDNVERAAIEVPPNDVDAYCQALEKIRDDRALYEEKRTACISLQEMFYDPKNSWGNKMRRALKNELGSRIL